MNAKRRNGSNDIKIRSGRPSDYENVISVMPAWWEGRDLTSMLPKVFFIHFYNTILIAEARKDLIGFLVGFLSQSEDKVGYIHFVGVHPDYRKLGVGRLLYEKFYAVCRENNRSIVRSCTSPINGLSITFHSHLGFIIEPGDGHMDGIPVTMGYFRKDEPMVLFKKVLDSSQL